MILTTHDLDDITRLCSRLMIIDHGRLIYDGTWRHATLRHDQVLVSTWPRTTVQLPWRAGPGLWAAALAGVRQGLCQLRRAYAPAAGRPEVADLTSRARIEDLSAASTGLGPPRPRSRPGSRPDGRKPCRGGGGVLVRWRPRRCQLQPSVRTPCVAEAPSPAARPSSPCPGRLAFHSCLRGARLEPPTPPPPPGDQDGGAAEPGGARPAAPPRGRQELVPWPGRHPRACVSGPSGPLGAAVARPRGRVVGDRRQPRPAARPAP